ncbi:hypothetical protein WHR41_04469 [Cladosporium halotolerans]|uniref:SET domain-containing protein n=1 Tax=Cladosporium halotolerans TaxID=1052096 RepID=A0AB34KNQ3_9PEZI
MSDNDQRSHTAHEGETQSEEMIPLQRCPHLSIKYTPEKGRGVFATAPLPAHTILDTSPVLVLSPTSTATHISHTELNHYTYNWPLPSQQRDSSKTQALILGLGSMFNHSSLRQNVGWTRDVAREVVVYQTLRAVEPGEELCISYGAPGQLTFVDAEAEAVRREEEEEERREVEGGGGLGGIEL